MAVHLAHARTRRPNARRVQPASRAITRPVRSGHRADHPNDSAPSRFARATPRDALPRSRPRCCLSPARHHRATTRPRMGRARTRRRFRSRHARAPTAPKVRTFDSHENRAVTLHRRPHLPGLSVPAIRSTHNPRLALPHVCRGRPLGRADRDAR
jgi:hypothetical protein